MEARPGLEAGCVIINSQDGLRPCHPDAGVSTNTYLILKSAYASQFRIILWPITVFHNL